MLNEIEKKGCYKILELLSLDSLISLTDTVTGKVVTVESKEGLYPAVLLGALVISTFRVRHLLSNSTLSAFQKH